MKVKNVAKIAFLKLCIYGIGIVLAYFYYLGADKWEIFFGSLGGFFGGYLFGELFDLETSVSQRKIVHRL